MEMQVHLSGGDFGGAERVYISQSNAEMVTFAFDHNPNFNFI